jgi:hypothetical protein
VIVYKHMANSVGPLKQGDGTGWYPVAMLSRLQDGKWAEGREITWKHLCFASDVLAGDFAALNCQKMIDSLHDGLPPKVSA